MTVVILLCFTQINDKIGFLFGAATTPRRRVRIGCGSRMPVAGEGSRTRRALFSSSFFF